MAAFQFFGYIVRSSRLEDVKLAAEFSRGESSIVLGAAPGEFWIRQTDKTESFVVSQGPTTICFYQVEHVGKARGSYTEQARIHVQSNPKISAKRYLRAITTLVPLIEKALALRGTQAIFFTSHSEAMARFMNKRLGYRYSGPGGRDGVIMAKGLSR